MFPISLSLSFSLPLCLDYKLKEKVERGKDLVLELYTPQARQVVFQRQRLSKTVLWRKGEEWQLHPNPRVKHDDWKVIVQDVGWEDEGTYQVLDDHGLALSTVLVTVTGEKHLKNRHL